MEKSDIFIYNGAGMEQWVDDVLESLDTEELTSVEASKGIKLLKDQDAHEHDHEHNSENDPHVWLDPQNAKYEMNKIKKALIKVDAENKDYYEANYKRYAKECDKLETGANAKMLNPLEGLSNKKIKAGEDYFSVMKQNLAAIKEALSE